MSRYFTTSSSEYLQHAGSPITAYPFTMSAWIYMTSTATEHGIVSMADVSTSNRLQLMRYYYTNLNIYSQNGTGSGAQTSGSLLTTETWHHVCGVFSSNSLREGWVDGDDTNKATSTGGVAFSSTIDEIAIGRLCDSTPKNYFDGRIAEVALWNAALSLVEVQALAKGYSPLLIKSGNLVSYWPLIRDEDQDRVGGYDMTAYNTPTIAAHPPVIYPVSPFIPTLTATGTASDVLNRGLGNIEAGVIASQGGGHSGLHPIDQGFIS